MTCTPSATLPDHAFQIVSSDTTVFQDHTNAYYNIKDGEIIRLSKTDRVSKSELKSATEEKVVIDLPPGINHYFVLEMKDQPSCVAKALGYGGRLKDGIVYLGGLDQVHHMEKVNPELLSRVENVVLAACGTSHYACRYAEYVMRRMGVFQYVKAQIASEIQE